MLAPRFAEPDQIKVDEEAAPTIDQLYRDGCLARQQWAGQHDVYDQMFRGKLGKRVGPWEGAADLHVQMPYWLVDSINVRLVASIWNQTPLVAGKAEEESDQEAFRRACQLVDWHVQPNRMGARAMWNRMSKIRLIHGVGTGLISYAHDTFRYRTQDKNVRFVKDKDGSSVLQEVSEPALKEGTFYDGPVLTPLEWDDVVVPVGCTNLQPKRGSNPLGADWVILRQWETLSLIFQKVAYKQGLKGKWAKKEEWIAAAPSQTRSGSETNDRSARTKDREEGIQRSQHQAQARRNPEFEILTYFGPWHEGDETDELVVFVCRDPMVVLGAYRLSDLYYRGRRPLLELHYQTIGTRYYSMGVMEIVKHLSAELDTIHNMRLDVGQATNLPFFFYRAASSFDPDEIELKPLKGIPVDNIDDIRFPQMQNVTTFYYQEETLLYTLVERVLGVTDLFLGISPTKGAAARHATGFVGTQQEALARTSEIVTQDAEAFSNLCHFIYDLEMQYGPEERSFRLMGDNGMVASKLDRDALWMQGDYDFRLGANQGMYSQMVKQQQAQAVMGSLQNNPFTQNDMGRQWEVFARYYYSLGLSTAEVEAIIGPKSAVDKGVSKTQDVENGAMAQYTYGISLPAPVHPNDNDAEHMKGVLEFLSSNEYTALNRPNEEAFIAHYQAHKQQQVTKQMQAQQPQAPPQQPQQQGGQDRMMAQMIAQPGTISGVSAAKQPQSSIPNPPQVKTF